MDHMTAKVSCFERAYHYQNNTVIYSRIRLPKRCWVKIMIGSL